MAVSRVACVCSAIILLAAADFRGIAEAQLPTFSLGGLSASSSDTCGSQGPESFQNGSGTFTCSSGSFPPALALDGVEETRWQARTDLNYAVINISLPGEFSISEIQLIFRSYHAEAVAVFKSVDGGLSYSPLVLAAEDQAGCERIKEHSQHTIGDYTYSGFLFTGHIGASDVGCSDLFAPTRTLPESNPLLKLIRVEQGTAYRNHVRANALLIEMFNISQSALANNINALSINDVHIRATCSCNGLATNCSQDTGVCYACMNNTCGTQCETCCPNANNLPQGQYCELCNCNQHADSCFYNPAIGFGQCNSCANNTAGNSCEECQPGYFHHPALPLTSASTCQSCNCNQDGTSPSSNFNCAGQQSITPPTGKSNGDCTCKANVQGAKCDVCSDTFFNLTSSNPDGCQDCSCNPPGTNGSMSCNKANGQCYCKAGVDATSRQCSVCALGFYSATGRPESALAEGCLRCECDPAGSQHNNCERVGGQCPCLVNSTTGRQCNSVAEGFFLRSPHYQRQYFAANVPTPYDPLDTCCEVRTDHAILPGFQGIGYILLKRGQSITMRQKLTTTESTVVLAVRYATPVPGNVTLNITAYLLSPMDFTLTLPSSVSTASVAVTPTMNTLSPVGTADVPCTISADRDVYLDYIAVVPGAFRSPSANLDPACAEAVLRNATSSADVSCQQQVFVISLRTFKAQPCNCANGLGHCAEVDGKCDCAHGVGGQRCDFCLYGHHGTTAGCQSCQCADPAAPCAADTGLCQCPTLTVGSRCDACNITAFTYSATAGCSACGCDVVGSSNSSCHPTQGICHCRPNVDGDKCTACKASYTNFTTSGCQDCNCHPDGSTSPNCSQSTTNCDCKDLTMGRYCHLCQSGSYNLAAENAGGCADCHCFGHTSTCNSTTQLRNTVTSQFAAGNVLNDWQLTTRLISLTTASLSTTQVSPGKFGLTADLTSLATSDTRYFAAPRSFLGDKISSYGGYLSYWQSYTISALGVATTDPDIILVSGTTVLEYTHSTPLQLNTPTQRRVRLHEMTGWQIAGSPATRNQLMIALRDVEWILIKATHASTVSLSRIWDIELETADVSGTGRAANEVEQCSCPQNYTGSSCQWCNVNYMRFPSTATAVEPRGICVDCICNVHALDCHEANGTCIECSHNTTGLQCETCLPGFYGDATAGTPGDCKICPCSTPQAVDNTCSQQCAGGSCAPVQCTQCNHGYEGDTCQTCSRGFYRHSTGICTPCQCNNNTNVCDILTGECLNCSPMTTGPTCQDCADRFFGDARAQSCQACGCNMAGSRNLICNRTTGVCDCLPNRTGDKCSGCVDGTYDHAAGCVPCQCDVTGSHNQTCNKTSGQCPCRPGVTGMHCQGCADTYYNFTASGCRMCGCHVAAVTPVCDKTSGVCQCDPGATGRRCDQCHPQHSDIADSGCTTCDHCSNVTITRADSLDISNPNADILERSVGELQARFLAATPLIPLEDQLSGTRGAFLMKYCGTWIL
ncbi:laminin-like protein epi-1 [Sycon ciliatum]|uniref:laminin-like protein epi-1 n=1 Tax=Sycon ciliatum TaxID=27933 RepID=UPI0031F645AD